MKKIGTLLLLFFCLFRLHAQLTPDVNNILYVNKSVTGGSQSGNSWGNAITELADALKYARTNNNYSSGNPLKIYVAKGAYKPLYHAADGQFTTDGGRDNAFVMVNNVQLYGGFDPDNGVNTLAQKRILGEKGTILSGDIGILNANTDNTYHIVISAGDVGVARLDGFAIKDANASQFISETSNVNGRLIGKTAGGGMYNYNSSPTVQNCNFSVNSASTGGAMFNFYSSPVISHCYFERNSAINSGGAIYNSSSSPIIDSTFFEANLCKDIGGAMYSYSSSPTIKNCNFKGNSANSGAGMYNSLSTFSISNCVFKGNAAKYSGGGIYNSTSSFLTIKNSIFIENSANSGGAMYNYYASPEIINITSANNGSRGFLSDNGGSFVFKNSIIWDPVSGSYTATSSLIKDNTSNDNGNISASGLAVEAIFTNYSGGDYSLRPNSLVIDKGNNALYTGNIYTDQDLVGNTRLYKGIIDIGAYEYQELIVHPADNILYVKKGGSGLQDGSSWLNALGELSDALKWANAVKSNYSETSPLQIWVTGGIYKPQYRPDNFSADNPTDKDNSFLMVDNVKLYGGFSGTESAITERIFSNDNKSVLSGDYNDDDVVSGSGVTLTISNNSENAYHVLSVANSTAITTSLDGFTITGGNANGSGSITVNGSTIYKSNGGGIYSSSSSLSDLSLMNCSVVGNAAAVGSGVFSIGSTAEISLLNTVFSRNVSTYSGGIYISSTNSRIKLINVTFAGNSGEESIAYDNSGPKYFTAYNSIVYNNSPIMSATKDIRYSLVQGENTTENGNIDGTLLYNELFSNGINGDYSLSNNSLVINKGNNALYSGNITTDKDLSGNPRLFQNVIDLGAYESQFSQINPSSENILYVKKGGSGMKDGSSWTNAIAELADALKYARTNNNYSSENPLKIYVGKGLYKPMYNSADGQFTIDGGRDNSFVLVKNVQLYGGFDPLNDIVDLTDVRIYGSGGSILSGDIGVEETNNDNTYHVVISSGNVGIAKLDGFSIRNGYANGNTDNFLVNGINVSRSYGGGMFNTSSDVNNTNPFINNCTFSENVSSDNGGGMYIYYTSPRVTNCSFTNNSAKNGGGIHNDNSYTLVDNCSFNGNNATWGAGMYNVFYYASISNSNFFGNTAANGGGGMFNGYGYITIRNCSFTDNTASTGGGIYNNTTFPNFINITCANNGTHGFFSNAGKSNIQNSVIWDAINGTNTILSSFIRDLVDNTNGNINAAGITADELFKDFSGGDYRLKSNSPVIGKGSNVLYGGTLSTDKDLAGNPRLFGTNIDMGAYEYQSLVMVPTNNILYVKKGGSGLQDGSSWLNAVGELSDALKWSNENKDSYTDTNPLQIWVAGGIYKPRYRPDNFSEDNPTDRDNSFLMVDNVKLYGGFSGMESTITERIFSPDNKSVLSGDYNDDDIVSGSGTILTISNNSENAYHVVTTGNTININTMLDGFKITGGNANGSGSILVNGVTIARNYGGGIFSYSLSGSTFSNVKLMNSSVVDNSASYGGGLYSGSSGLSIDIQIQNSSLNGNLADFGAAAFLSAFTTSNLSLTNSSISGNRGIVSGGAIHMVSSTSSSSIKLYNSTVANNSGTQIVNFGGAGIKYLTAYNSIVYSNTGNLFSSDLTKDLRYSLVQGESATTNGNIDGALTYNSLFINVTNGDYSLSNTSPVIEKGSNFLYGSSLSTDKDLVGNPRLYGTNIDMGAYEYQGGNVLPVTLLDFSARVQGAIVNLWWTTASEINNKGFHVERSSDGKSFLTLGFVGGNGNVNSEQQYSYMDKFPLPGYNYYRLRQEDFDGKTSYSSVRQVNVSSTKESKISLYPNPARQYIKIETFKSGSVQIFDVGGRLVSAQLLQAGVNTVSLQSFRPGVYFVVLGNDRLKFVKE